MLFARQPPFGWKQDKSIAEQENTGWPPGRVDALTCPQKIHQGSAPTVPLPPYPPLCFLFALLYLGMFRNFFTRVLVFLEA